MNIAMSNNTVLCLNNLKSILLLRCTKHLSSNNYILLAIKCQLLVVSRFIFSVFKGTLLIEVNNVPKTTKISMDNREKYISLGLNIAYYRKREGMTQEQLAESANISRSYLGEIEAPNMVTTFTLEVLFNIANALKIPPYKLIEFRD